MIAIVDYGSGNVAAIANIYKQLKIPHIVTGNIDDLIAADRYILPGVGAFDTVMNDLNRLGIAQALGDEVLGKGKKAMGICVGMQILADSSDEGRCQGLGWVPGKIRKIDKIKIAQKPKLPHMGWNNIDYVRSSPMFANVDEVQGFYFLHSFYFDPADPADTLANVTYGDDLACAVSRGNVYGFQFHPEKSHNNGVAIFRNFAKL